MKFHFAIILLIYTARATSCTSFFINTHNKKVLGKNYDWITGIGQIIKNNKGLIKKSLVNKNEDSINWTSKYGSFTFNQYGKEFPLGGMNSEGLVIEILWLEEASDEPKDHRPVVNELQWIQYQLDLAATVDEVIKLNENIRVHSMAGKVHYMVADKNGDYATIEFINEKCVISKNMDNPFAVTTNNPIQENKKYNESIIGLGGESPLQKTTLSKDRNALTCLNIKSYDGSNSIRYAFNALKAVSYSATVWSIVYDLKNLKIYFRTKENMEVQFFDLKSFSYDCKEPSKSININTKRKGNINSYFKIHSSQQNKDLVNLAFEEIELLSNLNRVFIDMIINYPSSVFCQK